MKVVVILPTYNERENINIILDRLLLAVKPVKNHQIEYLVVDDTSPDGTSEVVRQYQKKRLSVHLFVGKKEGLGKAILRGMNYAINELKADLIVQMDADLSHDPGVVPNLIKAIDDGADFAVGSRYIPGGSIPENWGIHRKIYSVCANSFVRLGLGQTQVHDWTGGFRAYKSIFAKKLISDMAKYNGYVFQIAFLHKSLLLGAKIKEVPIHFTDRKYGTSKIVPSEYIMNVFKYVFIARWFDLTHGSFGKFLVVGTIGFIINTLLLEVFVRLKFDPSIASAIGAEFAIISNFILNNSWTFNYRKITGFAQLGKFFQFNTTSLGAILIQAGSVFIGTRFFGLQTYRIWYMVGVGIGLIWNYFMYSRVIWKKNN
jgi:dolichol-phosphate mannosyltransferase